MNIGDNKILAYKDVWLLNRDDHQHLFGSMQVNSSYSKHIEQLWNIKQLANTMVYSCVCVIRRTTLNCKYTDIQMEPANLQKCQHVTNKISTKRYKKVCLNIFKMIQTFWNDYQNCIFSVNSVHQTFLSATFTTSSKSYKYIGIANLGKSVIKGLIHSFSIYSNKTVACILLLGKLLF